MALIVEDGSIVSGAESYLTVAETSTILASFGKATAFDAVATEAEKEVLLRSATLYIDSNFGDRFKGYLMNSTQELLFPRSNVEANGRIFASNEIPKELKQALAFAVADSITIDITTDDGDGSVIVSESVGLGSGALSESKGYNSDGKQTAFYSKSLELALSKLLKSSNRLEVGRC